MHTIRVVRIDVVDQSGVGPVPCDVVVVVTDDSPAAVALKMSEATDVRRCTLPRKGLDILIDLLRRPIGDNWPDKMLPHPVKLLTEKEGAELSASAIKVSG